MAEGRFTKEQIDQLGQIEDFRVANGLSGYGEAIEILLTGFMKQEGLTVEDLKKNQGKLKNTTATESFAELLAACKPTHVDPNFTTENWPLEPIEPDEDEWEITTHRFNGPVFVSYGLHELEEMAKRNEIRLPTGSRRVMKWITRNTSNQRSILPIMKKINGQFSVPVFFPFFDPILALVRLDDLVGTNHSWLILRKKAEAVQVTNPVSEPPTQESFNELLAACAQKEINPNFTEKNWPLEPVEPDEDEWEVVEHQFLNDMTLDQGIQYLEKKADRGEIRLLKGSRRFMKWIAEHPDAQLDHTIILPMFDATTYTVPVFRRIHYYSNDKNRGMFLFNGNTLTTPDTRWLVLRKRTK